MTDSKLEEYIQKIKDSKNSNNKLTNYKKATVRLDELKTEYNKLCDALKKTKKKTVDAKSESNASIDKIITELNHINEELDNEKCDIKALIDNYVQYKSLLDSLEGETEKMKNEIYKVTSNKNKIAITKLEPDEIL